MAKLVPLVGLASGVYAIKTYHETKTYLKTGGGFPCAEQVKWISVSRSAEITVWTEGASLGAILLVGSATNKKKINDVGTKTKFPHY